jgi:ABC-2 type transport system permease protein
MAIDTSHYHGWHGKLRGPWAASLAMVRVALLQVFRRKLYWLVIGVGLLQFLFFWSAIYLINQVTGMSPQFRQGMEHVFRFSATADDGGEDGYSAFMERQGVVVAILLAFSGSLLVGNDFRQGALPFYLSRRIDRRHYILAKLAAVSSVVSLLTVIPALLLFFEYGMFTSNTSYWRDNWRIVLSVLGYGAVMCAVLSIWLVSLSAWLQKAAPIAITWTSLFIMLGLLAGNLEDRNSSRYWHLIDPARQMRYVGRLLFGVLEDPVDRQVAWYALAILVSTCTLAMVALVHRVRAVEVVE